MPYEKLTQMHSCIIVGARQTAKAIKKREVKEIYVATDADQKITDEIIALAEAYDVPYQEVDSMKDLGTACGIEVGTSTAAIRQVET